MNKSFIIKILPLTILLFSATCSKPDKSDADNKVYISLSPVKKVSMAETIHATGRLASKQEMKLSFKTSGIIQKTFVDEGDFVRKGQILATLNLSELQAVKSQAKTAYDKALRDFERAEKLYRDSVATKEQYQNARSAVDAAKAQLDIVAFNMEHSSIKAPSDGRILKLLSEANEITAAGYPIILFAGTDDAWVVRAGITGKDHKRIKQGDAAIISLNAYPDTVFRATVSETGAFANPYTGSFELELKLKQKPAGAATGMIAKAEIISSEKKTFFALPADALLEAENKTVWVYLYKNGAARKKALTMHGIRKDQILISEGIKETDSVISKGALYIRPDSKLIIRSETQNQ